MKVFKLFFFLYRDQIYIEYIDFSFINFFSFNDSVMYYGRSVC